MVVVDLGGAVCGRVAVCAQHVVGPLVGAVARMPAAGARAGDPHRVGQAALADLVGEHLLRHRRPADVARADEGDVQRLGLRHRAPREGRRRSRRAPARRRRRVRRSRRVRSPSRPRRCRCRVRPRPRRRGTRSPTISTRSGSGSQLGQRVRHHVGLGGADAVDAGARDDLEMLVEPEVREDPPRRRLGLRRGHRQPHTGGPQVGQQLRDAVEQAVHRPAAGGVVGPVGGDRGVGVRRRAPSRAACDASAGRRCGRPGRRRALGADLAERVAEAGHDALRRVGQGAVEVEDHQLRARRDGTAQGFCHASIVADVYCRAVASQSRAAARYHGDQAAVPGMLDFAVNVRAAEPPSWLVDRLAARMADLGRYPSAADERRAMHAVAARHGRSVDEVALLAGAAEGLRCGNPRLARPRWRASRLPDAGACCVVSTKTSCCARHGGRLD